MFSQNHVILVNNVLSINQTSPNLTGVFYLSYCSNVVTVALFEMKLQRFTKVTRSYYNDGNSEFIISLNLNEVSY